MSEPVARPDLAEWFPDEYDDAMYRCHRLAHETYETGVLDHEGVARRIAEFLRGRIGEGQAESPEREAGLSIVNACEKTATYLSNGMKSIKLALAVLFRLAMPYASHPEYDKRWRP